MGGVHEDDPHALDRLYIKIVATEHFGWGRALEFRYMNELCSGATQMFSRGRDSDFVGDLNLDTPMNDRCCGNDAKKMNSSYA